MRWRLWSFVWLALASAPAWADRPFIATTGAAAEEDDDRVWSLSAVADVRRGTREFGLAAEYAFDPERSVEFGVGHARLRDAGSKATDVEVEYKQLFNHIARDGWGWGVAVGLGAQSSSGSGWRGGGWSLTLPLSLAFADGESVAHFNAGLVREPGASRETALALGVERRVTRRVTLFAEAARAGGETLLHGGLRWWVQRERFAVDLGVTRRREDGDTRRGAVLGLAWYDL